MSKKKFTLVDDHNGGTWEAYFVDDKLIQLCSTDDCRIDPEYIEPVFSALGIEFDYFSLDVECPDEYLCRYGREIKAQLMHLGWWDYDED